MFSHKIIGETTHKSESFHDADPLITKKKRLIVRERMQEAREFN